MGVRWGTGSRGLDPPGWGNFSTLNTFGVGAVAVTPPFLQALEGWTRLGAWLFWVCMAYLNEVGHVEVVDVISSTGQFRLI